jgi:hypothetical protein
MRKLTVPQVRNFDDEAHLLWTDNAIAQVLCIARLCSADRLLSRPTICVQSCTTKRTKSWHAC